jgi:hypothetical protein
MIALPVTVSSQDEQDETSLANDIYMALTLQGINCGEISELEESEVDGYDVKCVSGGSFSISKTKDGILRVVDRLRGIVRKGIGKFLDNVPLTERIFHQKEEITEHDAEVARSLFSIIKMSGNACEAITGIDNNASDEHIVSCANEKYRVFTSEDGLVVVEALTGDGS